ncbi:MAG: retropepsin-like aspartic protease [Steroidobacteraceae bacterium]
MLISVHADETPASDPVTADDLQEVIITAPEPRYVAPTRRDKIGRIWAPVYINEKGPFRLVLDTGASHSGITAAVAEALELPLNQSGNVRLRGVTGSAVVPTVKVNSLTVGDLLLNGKRLPIITDALGGAEGILGTEGLADRRIYIDFRRDLIIIGRSHNERAEPGFVTIPVKYANGKLLTVDARMGSVKVKAIIDTGGQATIANLATRDALFRKPTKQTPSIDTIVGATADEQMGEGYATPPLELGDIIIRSSHMTFGDMHIFEHWKLTDQPAILIGMDALGLLDTLIIDYKRDELQVKVRSGS